MAASFRDLTEQKIDRRPKGAEARGGDVDNSATLTTAAPHRARTPPPTEIDESFAQFVRHQTPTTHNTSTETPELTGSARHHLNIRSSSFAPAAPSVRSLALPRTVPRHQHWGQGRGFCIEAGQSSHPPGLEHPPQGLELVWFLSFCLFFCVTRASTSGTGSKQRDLCVFAEALTFHRLLKFVSGLRRRNPQQNRDATVPKSMTFQSS